MKILTCYNNKGGVSKTTTLFNLATYISKLGKKVLIADFDPQCNLTELFFASQPQFNTPKNKKLPGTSISQAFEQRFAGDVAKCNCKNIILSNYEKMYPNLYLLRGDLCFADDEKYFASAWMKGITTDVHEKNTYLSIFNLLTDLGSRYNFDFIFCDLGPSTGYITRLVFLGCDGYFVPMNPDRFNNMALNVLIGRQRIQSYDTQGKTKICKVSIIKEWMEDHKLHSQKFEPLGLRSFPGAPQFLGGTLNCCSPQSNEAWERLLKKNLSDYLNKKEIPIHKNLDIGNPFVAIIPYLGPLPSIAHLFGIAIFDLTEFHLNDRRVTRLISKMCLIQGDKSLRKSISHKRILSEYWPDWSELQSNYLVQIKELYKMIDGGW